MGHLAPGPEQVGDRVGAGSQEWEPGGGSLEQRVKHRGQGQEETLVPSARLLTCPSGTSSTARRASSGAQRNRPQLLRVSDVLCRVSSVCSRGRVRGCPKNKGLAIIILRVSSGRRIGGDSESFGKLWRPGSVPAHAVSAYTGLGQVQRRRPPARVWATKRVLGPGNNTHRSAEVQSLGSAMWSLLARRPSRRRVLKPVSAHAQLH